ncbi:MAG: TolC family protein [Bacteroidales bacterium]
MNQIKNIIILLFVYLFSCTGGQSQEKYDLRECMIYASEHAPANDRQVAQQRIYKQDKTEAWGAFLPSAGVSANAEYNFGRSLDPATNTYQDNKYFNNNYSASLDLPLFNGLVRVNNFKMTEAIARMGNEQVQVVRDRISLRVINAYYNVIYYRRLVDQMEGKLAESERNLYQSLRMEELGLRAGADVAQMEANVAADQFGLTRQLNLLENAWVELKCSMNFPLEDTLAIDESLGRLIPELSAENPDSLFKRASVYLPEALAARHQLVSMKYNYKKSMGSFFPTLSMYAGYNTNYFEALDSGSSTTPFKDQFRNNAGQYVGVRVSIPVFNRLSKISDRRRARFRLQMQEADYEETMLKLQQNITEGIADMNSAAREYIQAVRKMNAAEIAHNVNRRKFEEGMISALELQNSANQLAQAQAEQVGMHVQYLIRKKQVDFYNGIPFISPVQ